MTINSKANLNRCGLALIVLLIFGLNGCSSVPVTPPNTASELSGTPVVVNGEAALAEYASSNSSYSSPTPLPFGDQSQYFIRSTWTLRTYMGVPAFHFNLASDSSEIALAYDNFENFTDLYITHDRIVLISPNKQLTTYKRSEIISVQAVDVHGHGITCIDILLMNEKKVHRVCFREWNSHLHMSDFYYVGLMEEAKWAVFVWNNFDAGVQRFVSLTAGLPVQVSLPLTPQQQQYLSKLESEADLAVRDGDWRLAVADYANALGELPLTTPSEIVQRLRDSAISANLHLNQPLPIPAAAEQQEVFGKSAAETANNNSNLFDAIRFFKHATRIAPWWPDGYYNLAVVLEKAKMYGTAADALQWYLRAAPNAPDAANVKLKIYNLQYQQSQQQPNP